MLKCTSAVLVVTLGLVASGCKGPTDPSQNTTQTFTATVAPGGLDVKPVVVGNTGEFNIKLTALTPGNVFLGVAWGQGDGGANCAPMQSNPGLSSGNVGRTVISGSIFIKGNYCVVVFDPANSVAIAPWPVAQTYTVEVNHP